MNPVEERLIDAPDAGRLIARAYRAPLATSLLTPPPHEKFLLIGLAT